MVHLSTEEVNSLKIVLEYVLDSEGKNYEEYIQEGGKPENHVFHHANMMMHILELKKDLPDTKLTGDTNKFFEED